ncbi:unnamed protein product [Didymodactylos carnosus]|uniref:EF-hand domain-containing protein n=3 Tax=Didymodactylos carnosus TaxID=1234261 RepID=A0A8S2E3H7_9BILA|nr:unnamed protein product [Didymodactylos carnosus]CAF3823024.1 unnamed protein product [Didymodactylos carnosus]
MGGKSTKAVDPTVLTPKQIDLLKVNTKFNEQEIRDWHTGFIRDCPTGKLDKKAFVQVYKQFYPQGKADAFCKYAFQTFDEDDNGTIDFNEFLLAVAASSQGDLDDRLAVAFDMYDISDDGQIDAKELANMISAMYDLTGETNRKGDMDPKKRAQDLIQKLDVGSDKKISKEEFIAGCKSDPVIRKMLAPNA